MPGNEIGDRVHNFFAQDNTSQGQHHSHAALSNNFCVGGQRQIDLLDPNKSSNSQNSEIDRGPGNYPLHLTHGMNFAQSNPRSDFARSQSLKDHPNLNGSIYGNHHQTRQNEANFLAVDTGSDQHHLITSKGLSVHDAQQGRGTDPRAKASVRLKTSVSPVSFDLFGGQPQMNHQQSNMLQPLQHQQSGLNNMQQQLMIRKMQELQMQQQLQQNLINQVPPFAKQTSGNQSTLVNGTPNSGTSQYPWTAETGANWLNRGSPTMQGSGNGLVFPVNFGQTHQLVDSVPQQADQSLYGVPVSCSRGLTANEYSHMMRDRSSVLEVPIPSHSLPGHQHNLLPDQGGIQEESLIQGQKFQNENMLRYSSNQSVNADIRNMADLQHVNSMPAPQLDFLRKQEVAMHPQTWQEKPTRQVTSSQNEVALDPTEEKILFGSDDNIWAAFGTLSDISGEAGDSLDHGRLSRGLPSIQSGSWSALMQSAVAETSSSDVVPQEEWSGLTFNNNGDPSAKQRSLVYDGNGKQEASLVDDNVRMHLSLTSGSTPPSDIIGSKNSTGLNQFGHKFQNEPGQTLQTQMSRQFVQSMDEASNLSNGSPLQKPVAEGSSMYKNAMHHPLEAHGNAAISTPWVPGHTRTRQEVNGWNAMLPAGDRVQNSHETEKSLDSRSNQLRMMQGGMVHVHPLWKSNSISSPSDLVPGKSTGGNTQANMGILSVDGASSVSKASKMRNGDETSPFVQTSNLLNHWKTVNASAKSQGGESLGGMLHQVHEPTQFLDSLNDHDKDKVARSAVDEREVKDNSTDGHRSSLPQQTFFGFRESGFSDASDSRSFPTGKQKSNNQLTRKVSVPPKFQYHPMGDLDTNMEPTFALKQPSHAQAAPQQNTQFVQSNAFGLISRNYMGAEKSSELQRENKGSEKEPSKCSVPVYVPNMPVPLSRPFGFDSYTPNKASSSSQNMLELLHKVDQSRDHNGMMEFTSSECKASSEQPEAEKRDGGRLQRTQSSVSQGFGLQLGPPSQRLHIADHQLSSQNGHVAAEMGEKGQQMVPRPSVQFPFASEQDQVEFKRSANSGDAGHENSLYQIPRNFPSAFSSGIPYQQAPRVSGHILMNQQIDSSNGNVSSSALKGCAKNILADASISNQQDNFSSSDDMPEKIAPNDVQGSSSAVSKPSKDHAKTSQHFPTNLHTSGAQFHKALSRFPESFQPNIVESSSAPLTRGNANPQGAVEGEAKMFTESSGQVVAAINSHPDPVMKESLGKLSSTKNYSDDTPVNSASTMKDIEAFGRSLKPSSFAHQNYSLLNQMWALKDAETDESNRVSKRMKGPDNLLDAHQVSLKPCQQNENNAVLGDCLSSGTGVVSDESRMLYFSRPSDISQKNFSQNASDPSKDVFALGQSNSSSDTNSVRADHPQVSPQMAPSWFSQYGTLRNGQVLPLCDSRNLTPLRPGKIPFTLGKSSSGLDALNSEDKGTDSRIAACQVGNSHDNSTPSFVANGLSSSQSSQMNMTGQHMATLRPKKRRSATSELHPWHEDESESLQNYWTVSMAEAEWSKATNRIFERFDDGAELIEDGPGPPVPRSKRRLIVTTQLMQQLLSPAPAAILSADAISDYESVAYAVSRTVLGDARSIISRSTELDMPFDNIDMRSANGKLTERNCNQRFAKAIEELIRKSRKLENDILRLDKSALISDLKVESQDLEKFSVINRFARFHGRWQNDSVETSASSSSEVTAATQNPLPQRYVTAHPISRSLPDRVQCLSL